MNQIFQNMTKGEWEIDGYNLTAVIAKTDHEMFPSWKHVLTCNYGYAKPEDFVELNMVNAKAITLAVNNTYGKGINPESVPALHLAVMNLCDIVERHLPSYSASVQHAREALTASKL